jgi:hypothetical protein
LPLHHTYAPLPHSYKRLFLACALAAAAHAQVSASIGGQIYNVANDAPINGATIVLTLAAGASTPVKFVTETRGLFIFENLPPGRYMLFAESPGFARTAFGSRGNPLAGVTLSLVDGQQMTGLAFALTPGASISGKVTDAAGAPADRAIVLALQPIYQRGKKEYIPLASAPTDTEGNYKLENLNAGAYLLAATDRSGAAPTSYYPSSAIAAGADTVTVAAAGAQTAKDIHLAAAAGHRVSGGIAGGGKAALAWLTPKGGATSLISRASAKIQPGGGFVFSSIAAGAYILSATEEDGVTTAAAPIAVTVARNDVEGLTLRAQAGGELNGDITLGLHDVEMPKGMQVVLEAADAPLPRPARAAVDEHGKFTFHALAPGRYLVHLLAPEALYVRSVHYRGLDFTDTPFDYGGGVPSPLAISLSAGGASLSGSVRGPDDSPMPGATVSLVPTLRHFSRFKEVTADQFGEFHFEGIAPGDYTVFAWDHIDTAAYQDAAWLRKYEFRGHAIAAKPGSHEAIGLKAIQ